jgi:hypothetical protein
MLLACTAAIDLSPVLTGRGSIQRIYNNFDASAELDILHTV